MRNVKWLFVVLLISSLTAFVGKDKPIEGLSVGDVAPDFKIESTISAGTIKPFRLKAEKGKYVLLSFWASYDAPSRMQNVSISNVFRTSHVRNVEMVSISFDAYQSVFDETLRDDQIVASVYALLSEGSKSDVYNMYDLEHGFGNYLIDENGIIVAKNITAKELSECIDKV